MSARVPTGVAIRDVRQQLFDAAERVLLRDGPSSLTSRTVTAEAGVAKGVLHRHFADFDAFLADFVLDRVEKLDLGALPGSAGSGGVVENVTEAVTALFASVAVAIVPLVTFREELRARLREAWPAGVPVLTEAAVVIGEYLAAEQEAGRLAADAHPETLAAMLIGTAHLKFAGLTGTPPGEAAVRAVVLTVLAAALNGDG